MQKLDIMLEMSTTPNSQDQLYLPSLLPGTPKPFLKWAGGKTQLLAQFKSLYPIQFGNYFEPFVGSGAVFFHLYSLRAQQQIDAKFSCVRLSDTNAELINCYRIVRDDLRSLVELLTEHRRLHSHEHYYEVRSQSTERMSRVERAARLIYLNKTCYNGLYRVNRKGQFNVPMGSYKNPSIFDLEELAAASYALQEVDIEESRFDEVVRFARRGDFVYFDPPYHPLSATASFTSYTADGFGRDDQIRLSEVFKMLDGMGCFVMLSNSLTQETKSLYEGFSTQPVSATRAINSKADRRGKISELVILSSRLRLRR